MRNATKAGVAGLLTLGLLGGTTAAFASVDRHQSKDVSHQTASVDKSKDAFTGAALKSTDPASPDTRSSSSTSKDASSRDLYSKDMPSRDSISPDRISKDVFSKDILDR
jgi:hypothetical protein